MRHQSDGASEGLFRGRKAPLSLPFIHAVKYAAHCTTEQNFVTARLELMFSHTSYLNLGTWQ